MKLVAALIVVALTLSYSTGYSKPETRVEIAVKLYDSCLTGFHLAYGWPTTKEAAVVQTIDLDDKCVDWVGIWLPSLIESRYPGEITWLTEREEAKFIHEKNKRAHQYLSELNLKLE